MGSIQPNIQNVHFVGSIPLATNEDVMRLLATSLPTQLARIPDGEVLQRSNFVMWQRSVFKKHPWLVRSLYFNLAGPPEPLDLSTKKIELMPIGYDEYAVASYGVFCKLREEGVIRQGVKFQVSLPTPVNVIHVSVEPAYTKQIEPIYTKAYLGSVKKILETIPHEDLAIQWDVAVEFAFLEGMVPPPPHWTNLKEDIITRVLELTNVVPTSIDMGLHFCYGDLGHKHFIEPKDMSLLVEIANRVIDGTERPIKWMHMPVPRDRDDREYFEPLTKFKRGVNMEFYLGVLHQDDLEGTKRRIQAASEFVGDFGVATECGLGRADEDELNSVVEIAKVITE